MDHSKKALLFVGIGIIIGWILFVVIGAKPSKVIVGPVEVELPNPAPTVGTPRPTLTPEISNPVSQLALNSEDQNSVFPERFYSESGIPNSTSLKVKVDPETIHILTSGPICVDRTCLSGGKNRGSIVILLPREKEYTLTNLIPAQNWHGAYSGQPDRWKLLVEVKVNEMKMSGNCTGGKACEIVDILVVGPNGVISQYEI